MSAVATSFAALKLTRRVGNVALGHRWRDRCLGSRHVRFRGDRRTDRNGGDDARSGWAAHLLPLKPSWCRLDLAERCRLRQPIDHVEIFLLDHWPIVIVAVVLASISAEAARKPAVMFNGAKRFDELRVALVVQPGV